MKNLTLDRMSLERELCAYAPTGAAILGSSDTVPVRAEIASFSKAEDGTLDIDWAGGSEVFWDGQHTTQQDGEDLYLCDDGTDWKESELTFLPKADDYDELDLAELTMWADFAKSVIARNAKPANQYETNMPEAWAEELAKIEAAMKEVANG